MSPSREPKRYSSRRKNERELKLDYFSHVFADFCRLPKSERDEVRADLPPSLKILVEQIDSGGEILPEDEGRLDWGDMATFEDRILARQDDATLRRRAWQIRSRYARLVGSERYQLYLASRPPDENDIEASIDALRADLRRLLGATHFAYSLTIVRENNRRRVMKKVGRWTFGLCAAALGFGLVLDWYPSGDLSDYVQLRARLIGALFAVVLFGCLGAYLSIQRRLQESSDGGDPVVGVLGLHEFISIQPFPLIAGGLFAIVLYLIIAAKLMVGTLFPELDAAGVPIGMLNWAKLFIWAFLAGFAERLVPDTLDRLVNQAQPRVQAPIVPAAGRDEPREEKVAGPKSAITGIPSSATPGSVVTITGTGFGAEQGSGTVRFNGKAAASTVAWSDTEIRAQLPSELIGAIEIEVILATGQSLTPPNQSLVVDTE